MVKNGKKRGENGLLKPTFYEKRKK